jgi:Mor family transcriptional regulator
MNLAHSKHIATIPGLEKYSGYYVTKRGNIFSLRTGKLKMLKPTYRNPQDKSYLRIRLTSNDYLIHKSFSVHQLVALAYKYVDNWRSLTVDHIDENKSNNDISNLQWLTGRDNTAKGQLKRRKFSKETIASITDEYLNTTITLEQLSNIYDCSIETIWRVINFMSGVDNHKRRKIYNEIQKNEIRLLYKNGKSRIEISKLYNCSLSHICNICNISEKK